MSEPTRTRSPGPDSKLLSPSCSTLPDARIKAIVANAEVDINISTPVSCYVRSAKEMIRSANNYQEDGYLEYAYLLYMRFLIIFVEKIHTHPGYKNLPASDKKSIKTFCQEVLPKTEILKKELQAQFEIEFENYKTNLEIRKQAEEEAKQKLREEIEKEIRYKNNLAKLNESMVSSSINEVSGRKTAPPYNSIINSDYPQTPYSYSNSNDVLPLPSKAVEENEPRSTPMVDRTAKPSRILSPINSGLRNVTIPGNLVPEFLKIAKNNTLANIETCGILAGKIIREVLVITHLIIPKQKGTADSCTTENEEQIFGYQDKFNLITIGWIHTHPTQTAFLSSVDLHTHYSYQLMMPEAIALVCAPAKNETGIFMLNPTFGMDTIGSCQASGFHPHNQASTPIFQDASHAEYDQSLRAIIYDLRYQS